MKTQSTKTVPVRQHFDSAATVAFFLAIIAASSMWFYFDKILVPYQRQDAMLHARPRGNLSDLYPRWLGARELLLHHRNPYGEDVTAEIQEGYYGRELDPARAEDPKDRQGFAYPVYVVFLLAPLVGLPFASVQTFFHWLLIGLTVASVWLWLRALRWQLSPITIVTVVVFTLGSAPAIQGIKLQQLSLLVAALLAGSAACVTSGYLLCGGVLLGLATIKPQIALLMAAWLLVWGIADWRSRRRFVLGFSVTIMLLLLASELILPGWWRMFAEAIANYHRYTHNKSVVDELLPRAGTYLAVLSGLACTPILWQLRSHPENCGLATALVMALTVLVVPMSAPYNQVLLLPAILVLSRDRAQFLGYSRTFAAAYFLGAVVVAWPWIMSLMLAVCYIFVSPAEAFARWTWPFTPTFMIPVIVFGLIWLDLQAKLRESSNRGRVG